jgi:NADH-quinone oxidoreductase subunit C
MSARIETLAALVAERLPDIATRRSALPSELSIDVPAAALVQALTTLRDDPELRFEILIDVAGVDFLDYGRSEWKTSTAGNSGFGRGVNRGGQGGSHDGKRFACV